jgi:hypothetical protein
MNAMRVTALLCVCCSTTASAQVADSVRAVLMQQTPMQ